MIFSVRHTFTLLSLHSYSFTHSFIILVELSKPLIYGAGHTVAQQCSWYSYIYFSLIVTYQMQYVCIVQLEFTPTNFQNTGIYYFLLFCSFLPSSGKHVCGNTILIWKSKGFVLKDKTQHYDYTF